jgi:hypothetical protein
MKLRQHQTRKESTHIATLDSGGTSVCTVQIGDDHIHFAQLCDHVLVWKESGKNAETVGALTDSLALVKESCLC